MVAASTGIAVQSWLTVDEVGLDVDRTLRTVLDLLRARDRSDRKGSAGGGGGSPGGPQMSG